MSVSYACDVCRIPVAESDLTALKATTGRMKKSRPLVHLCPTHRDEMLTFLSPPESPGPKKAAHPAPKPPGGRPRPSAN